MNSGRTRSSEPSCVIIASVGWPSRSTQNPSRRPSTRFPTLPFGSPTTRTSSPWRWPAKPQFFSHATGHSARTSPTTKCSATWVDGTAAACLTFSLGCLRTHRALQTGGSSLRSGNAPSPVDRRWPSTLVRSHQEWAEYPPFDPVFPMEWTPPPGGIAMCQDGTELFRTRDLLVRQRTQTINALRGHLAEFGVVAPRGRARIRRRAKPRRPRPARLCHHAG